MGLVSISSCGGRGAVLRHKVLGKGQAGYMVRGRERWGQGYRTMGGWMTRGKRRNKHGKRKDMAG